MPSTTPVISRSPRLEDAPLRSMFVENIHANGPNVFAHEQYVVNGAEPNTTYDVVLTISIGDPTCTNPSSR